MQARTYPDDSEIQVGNTSICDRFKKIAIDIDAQSRFDHKTTLEEWKREFDTVVSTIATPTERTYYLNSILSDIRLPFSSREKDISVLYETIKHKFRSQKEKLEIAIKQTEAIRPPDEQFLKELYKTRHMTVLIEENYFKLLNQSEKLRNFLELRARVSGGKPGDEIISAMLIDLKNGLIEFLKKPQDKLSDEKRSQLIDTVNYSENVEQIEAAFRGTEYSGTIKSFVNIFRRNVQNLDRLQIEDFQFFLTPLLSAGTSKKKASSELVGTSPLKEQKRIINPDSKAKDTVAVTDKPQNTSQQAERKIADPPKEGEEYAEGAFADIHFKIGGLLTNIDTRNLVHGALYDVYNIAQSEWGRIPSSDNKAKAALITSLKLAHEITGKLVNNEMDGAGQTLSTLEKHIATEASGKSSLSKQFLGALVVFVGAVVMALGIAGVPYTAGLSLKVGMDIGGAALTAGGAALFQSGREKGVAKALTELKTAIKAEEKRQSRGGDRRLR